MFTKIHRKIIVKQFGGTKNVLIWIAAVAFTVYVIDTYILTRDRIESMFEDDPGKMSARVIPGVKIDADVAKHIPKDVDDVVPQQPEVPQVEETKEEVKPVEPVKAKGNCGLQTECKEGQVPYSIKSGYGRDGKPTICWNGEYLFSQDGSKGDRGINLAVVNDKTFAVEEIRTFDTYSEDAAFMRFLKLGVNGHQILLMSSVDEITTSLSPDSKTWMEKHGASRIHNLKFRDAYIFVGQRGLKKGTAPVEMVGPRGGKDFADQISTEGCLTVPLGKLDEIREPMVIAEVPNQGDPSLKRGQEAPGCGVKGGCSADSFPVHIYTGVGNTEGPKICVSGKYVLAKGLNDGGRGFNVVIVDPKTKDVVRVGHFDTYAEDSSNLEIFLEMINEGEIIVAVTHDDASKKLSDLAKKLMNELGSGLIQNMQFRDVWAMVGQKGIDGFGFFEQYETKDPAQNWPVPIDKRVCVPTTIKGSKIKPDPMANKNEAKRKFCAKYDGYGDFCQADRIDEVLSPAQLTDKSMVGNAIFTVPVIIIPGLNHNAVRLQLETLMLNPGVDLDYVTVMYDEKFDEPKALAELFGCKSHSLKSSTKYSNLTAKALQEVWILYPKARHVIVLEEEVIVGPDFLYFLSQCLPTVDADDTLMGASAWNVNGYVETSGKVGTVYRTEEMLGLGFLLKKTFYETHMNGKMQECCSKRSWDGWTAPADYEMLVPDTSRVYRRPYEGLAVDGDFMTALFNRDRTTNLDIQASIGQRLSAEAYDEQIRKMLKKGRALDTANAQDCLAGKGLGFYMPDTTGESFAIYFEQSNAHDYTVLSQLCKCFKLFHSPNHPPRGLHKNVLRFSYKDNHVFLVGSQSPFYDTKPSSYAPVRAK